MQCVCTECVRVHYLYTVHGMRWVRHALMPCNGGGPTQDPDAGDAVSSCSDDRNDEHQSLRDQVATWFERQSEDVLGDDGFSAREIRRDMEELFKLPRNSLDKHQRVIASCIATLKSRQVSSCLS
jgi:hypothetical protein